MPSLWIQGCATPRLPTIVVFPSGQREDRPGDGRVQRMRLWSCEGHIEGLESVRPVNQRSVRPTRIDESRHRSSSD
jgi:hypothetical protein